MEMPMSTTRSRVRRAGQCAALAGVLAVFPTACVGAGGTATDSQTLVIGMTAAEIPGTDTVLAFTQGFEGERFVNFQLYDGLTRYDLKQSTKDPAIVPGLATSWQVSPDGRTWTFRLRDGVTFADGTPFNADAVVFAYDRLLNEKSPHYYPEAAAAARLWTGRIASYKKLDDRTVQLTTTERNGHLLSDLTLVTIPSPTAVKSKGNKAFSKNPVGTGPFTFLSMEPGRQLTLAANKDYWGGAPKIDKLVLRPMPDASARIAALRSGEVNWIEYPNPDDIAGLKQAGYQILQNNYDHLWYCTFNTASTGWSDVRVRRAANYAINRQSIADDLLKGTAEPALQHAPKATAVYDPANDVYSYDPGKAKSLLREAGYPNGFSTTLTVPTGGSGNLIPVQIATALQTQLAQIGIKVQLRTVEWSAFLADLNAGKPASGADMQCASTVTFQAEALVRAFWAKGTPVYTGGWHNDEVNRLSLQAEQTIDAAARVALYRRAERLVSADSPYLFVVSDRNPRVLAPNVTGVVAPKSWFIDLTTASVG